MNRITAISEYVNILNYLRYKEDKLKEQQRRDYDIAFYSDPTKPPPELNELKKVSYKIMEIETELEKLLYEHNSK